MHYNNMSEFQSKLPPNSISGGLFFKISWEGKGGGGRMLTDPRRNQNALHFAECALHTVQSLLSLCPS